MAGSQCVATLVNVPMRILPGNERMQAFRRLPQQPLLPHDLVNIGHHLLALRREACAGARALQKRQLKLRLDGGEHMADARTA